METSAVLLRFHSINFPSEWGEVSQLLESQGVAVSIQLISPASGEETEGVVALNPDDLGFHSINFPSEWGGNVVTA